MSTQKPKSKDVSELSEMDAERLIYEAFKQAGKFIPQTPEEVEAAEAEFGHAEIKLPPSLQDPLAILKGKPVQHAALKPRMPTDAVAVENMACAAKNGSEIPPEVLSQMDRDEAQAEAEKEPKDGKD